MPSPVFRFELMHSAGPSGPRRGRIHTPHGTAETPCFAPVGTAGSIKGLLPRLVRETGTELVLANTYHLLLRPGPDVVAALGGLHRFMGFDGPILTDSGGFQVFSMADKCKVDDEGVSFASIVDGSIVRLTPANVLEIQRALGPDIAMVLDECVGSDATPERVREAHERTLRWARQARDVHESMGGAGRGQAVFGIVQGGFDRDLRTESATRLVELEFDGYAIGGLSVGEEKAKTHAALAAAVPVLPEDKVRYLMGVGTPEDLRAAVALGIDLFDCVTPTRHARNAEAFTRNGRLKLRNACHARDPRPLDEECACHTCRGFSRGYLRHLFVAREMLGGILLTIHNLHYFQQIMAELRSAISESARAAPGARSPSAGPPPAGP
jgi:queuine tRNA-ribosyltransferase